MKKHVSILLGLLVVFSSLFVSCDENELDSNICKITVKSEGNGTVSITDYIGTSVNVLIGNRVEVVATPDDGWAFIGWYVSGTESPVSTDAVFTFTTSESVTLTARFAKLSDIIIRSGGNGRVAFKGAAGNSIPVVPGTEVTVIATPDTDCDFVGWFVGDSETPISTEKVYTFTVTESIILTGQFSKRPIVTVRSAGNGSVSIKDTYGTYKAFLPGTETTVIATPYKDCDFIGWFVADNESPISTDLEYTFNVTENITLTAKFSKRPVVTISSTDNGNVAFKDTPGSSVAVLPDTEVTVVATPNENCYFVGWFVDYEESPVSTSTEYTFKVEGNITLTAKFNKWPTVTIQSIEYGNVSFKDYPDKSISILPDSEVTVIATPDEGCEFVGWFIDDTAINVSTMVEYTFNVVEDIVLTAKFNKCPEVTISSTGYGSVSFRDSSVGSITVFSGSEVTVIATPDEDCEFVGWFIDDVEFPVSSNTEYTFSVNEDINLIAKFTVLIKAIDLGLPSRTKWANMNIGSTKPEEYGDYYAWGETEEKEDCSLSTYKWCNGSIDTMTKYCTDSSYGTVDNKTVLESDDDVANVKWGKSWRMPTKEEQEELLYNCTWEWTRLYGINGYTVTGPNGNSIFLPAAGEHNGTSIYLKDRCGFYWSRSLNRNRNNCTYVLDFTGKTQGCINISRYSGCSVRPVCE